MPIGMILDVLCIFVGGLIGAVGGKYLPDKLRDALPTAFSLVTLAMGIINIVQTRHLPVVVLSLILGVAIGTMLGLEKLLRHLGEWVAAIFIRSKTTEPGMRAQNLEYFAIAVILFCTGPTGIYGVMQATMTGDNSLLYSKCFLDIFTATIFAANAGIIISLLSVPMFCVFFSFYLLSGVVQPHLTPSMLADFSGIGGLLILATGLRMAKIKMFNVTDMLPALALVIPLSYLWTAL